MKARVLPAVLSGEKIALAITEPSGGSDVASLKTTAGAKATTMWSTARRCSSPRHARRLLLGGRAHRRAGAAGVSLLLERDREGFTRTPLKKMGWWASDTAALYFRDVRVPAANLIGEEGRGFKAIMTNFNSERLGMAARRGGYAEAATRRRPRGGARDLRPEAGGAPR